MSAAQPEYQLDDVDRRIIAALKADGRATNQRIARSLRISPEPPAGTRWLELTMSPGATAIRVDLAGPGGEGGEGGKGGEGGGNEQAAGLIHGAGPVERLIDAVAVGLLYRSVRHEHDMVFWHDLAGVADIVTDRALLQEIWETNPLLLQYLGSIDNPELIVYRIRPKRVRYMKEWALEYISVPLEPGE